MKITTKIKELLYFLSLFIFINFLAALDYFVYLPRSLFYYEYIVVLFAIIYFRNLSFAYFLFCLIFILDIFDIISNIYLFDISELLSSLKFIFLFKFNFSTLLNFIFSILIFYINVPYF